MERINCPKCGQYFEGGTWESAADNMTTHLRSCTGAGVEMTRPNITDVVPEEAFASNLVSIEEVLGKTVLIKAFEFRESTFKEDMDYLTLVIEVGGEEKILNTGASRVVQVFKHLHAEALPVFAIFEKTTLAGGRRVYTIR